MIVIVTRRGIQLTLRSSAEQEEFESAWAKDREKAEFHVRGRTYITRCVESYTPRKHRGPYEHRVRFTMED